MPEAPTTRPSLLIRLRNHQDFQAWSQFVDLYAPFIYGFLRKRGLQESDCYTDEVHDDSAANDISAFDNADEVHHALDQLPLLQREALTLYFLEDLSLDEMAATLDVPLGTIKSRLHYAKLAMRKILTQGH